MLKRRKLNAWYGFLFFSILISFAGCGRKPAEIKITVIGVDWSNSLYCLDEAKERKRVYTLVKNIIEAKGLSQTKKVLIKTWRGELRGVPLETIIIIPIASDEVSFREKIRSGTPAELLNHIKDEKDILPEKNSYTHRTDFQDFFNLAKNEAEHKVRDLKDRSFAVENGIVKVRIEYILITDGIHDPKGLINVPNTIENINIKTIQNVYPNLTVESLANTISLPENTSKVFFIGVPPRLKFDLWQRVMDKKGIKCKFLEYEDLENIASVRDKLY